MRTVPIAQAKERLSQLVDDAARTHERVTITRHGEAAAVLLSVDDLETMEESLFWQAEHGIDEDIAVARAEAAADGLVDEETVRRRYHARRRS